MDENKEFVEFIKDNKVEAIRKNSKMAYVTNIILIVVFILIGTYIFFNIESFKSLGQDVCRLCEQKTGGSCLSQSYNTIVEQVKAQVNSSNQVQVSAYNFSGMFK